jgi:hypothetical protein
VDNGPPGLDGAPHKLRLLLTITVDVHSSVGGSRKAASASCLTEGTSCSAGSSTTEFLVRWILMGCCACTSCTKQGRAVVVVFAYVRFAPAPVGPHLCAASGLCATCIHHR